VVRRSPTLIANPYSTPFGLGQITRPPGRIGASKPLIRLGPITASEPYLAVFSVAGWRMSVAATHYLPIKKMGTAAPTKPFSSRIYGLQAVIVDAPPSLSAPYSGLQGTRRAAQYPLIFYQAGGRFKPFCNHFWFGRTTTGGCVSGTIAATAACISRVSGAY
jgi:hypothetical protein